MRKAWAFFLILLLGLTFSGPGLLYAQEQEDEPDYDDREIPIESDWDGYMPDLYSKGDKIFSITLGLMFPAFFLNKGQPIEHNFSPPVGGTGSLAYNYFFGSHFTIGGEIGVMFNATLAQNVVYFIPIGLRAGWQFVASRFEFPLSLTVGVAPQRYLNYGYLGFFMKGAASAFYRFSPDWSFGVNFDWGWYPQWPLENGEPVPDKNIDGNIIGLTISARYHF